MGEDVAFPPTHPKLVIDNVKMTRETLCVAQHAINSAWTPNRNTHSARLDRMIEELDRMRPIGPDGKHGNRHTDECGCEDELYARQRANAVAKDAELQLIEYREKTVQKVILMTFEYDADPQKVLDTAINLARKQNRRLSSAKRKTAKHRRTNIAFYQEPYETLISERIAGLLIGYSVLTKNPAGMNAPYRQT